MHPSVATFVFQLTIAVVLGAGDVVYKSNCFYEDAQDTCRSKTVDIGGRLYGCEDVVDFENEIIKIEFLGEPNRQKAQTILVQDSNNESYEIDEKASKKKKSNQISTESCTFVFDEQLNNTFKIEFGKASVTGPLGIKSRDIVTESGFIPKELALDPKTGMLVILALKTNNGVTEEGSLFAINVNTLSKNKKIEAQKISPRNVIFTGLSIYEGLDELIVGIKTDGQYKYIKLSAVPKENPCFRKRQKRSLQEEILSVLEETNSEESVRIAKLCSEYSDNRLPENPLIARQISSRTFDSKGPQAKPNTSGCDDKLERQIKLLEKVNKILKPIIKVREGPDFAKNKKALDDFFYEVHEMLLE